MKAFLGSLGFLTTIPIGRDEDSFNAFISNLWTMPLTGAAVGFLIWVLVTLLKEVGLENIVFVAYFLIEGINHVDGLSDFFDSVFARDKVRALKDTRIGVGGLTAVVTYILILYSILPKANLLHLMLAQSFAKSSMLLLLLRNEAAWEGMAETFKKGVRNRDYLGLIFPLILLVFSFVEDLKNIAALIVFLIVLLLVESYSRKHFNGISGDVLGAANCLTFAAVILCLLL